VAFASALSRHPVASEAIGEVAGRMLEELGDGPDAVVLTVTRHHAGALEDIAATVEAVLHPRAMAGCAAESVVAAGTELEGSPAIGMWGGRVGPVLEVAVDAHRLSDDSWRFVGWPPTFDFEPGALLLFADPFTFPVPEFLRRLEETLPGLPVVGGNASAGRGPGGTRLVAGRRVSAAGATGIILGTGVGIEPVVSQGCRPYGRTLTVTASDGHVVDELAGQPALQCLVEQARQALGAEDIAGIGSSGLHLGRLIDERIVDPGPGDFLVRTVVGVDRARGAIALDDRVPLGSTVRFCVRDAGTAHGELADLLRGRRADAVLAFACRARGAELSESDHHDAAAIERALGPVPVGGMFSAGEIGPIGGRSFLMTNSAALALLHARQP
jgi:small ligand-binding sensory domain FIST